MRTIVLPLLVGLACCYRCRQRVRLPRHGLRAGVGVAMRRCLSQPPHISDDGINAMSWPRVHLVGESGETGTGESIGDAGLSPSVVLVPAFPSCSSQPPVCSSFSS